MKTTIKSAQTFAAILSLVMAITSTALAESATWSLNPVNGDWNTDANWTPMDAPVSGGLAIFDVSNTTNISVSAPISVHGITFNAGASAFTITTAGDIHDGGITNNSGVIQNFIVASLSFRGNGTAGNLTAFHIAGDLVFRDESSAGSGTFTIEAGALIDIFGGSTAGNGTFTNSGLIRLKAFGGNATFTNNGGAVSGAGGGNIVIASGSGDNATFINNGGAVSGAGGGRTEFRRFSNAVNSTLIANGGVGGAAGGSIVVRPKFLGGNARVEVFGNGNLDISDRFRFPEVRFGSIEGSGMVFLGASNLTVGSNNLSTVFSGVMQDHGGLRNVSGGSLAKLGTATLTLSGANTYTGGTAINGGELLVMNTIGSGTGSGAVQVNSGTLSGRGTIAGAVTIGTGSGPGAILSPASGTEPFDIGGTLTIHSLLVFNSDATYDSNLNSQKANKVVALGVTINSGATFTFFDFSGGALAPGTVFTVIDNTATTPIAGTFSNLPDGSTFTSNGGNNFKVSYEGGTGNDLTLTVQ
jgi:autotransporter-associated beta strand protein